MPMPVAAQCGSFPPAFVEGIRTSGVGGHRAEDRPDARTAFDRTVFQCLDHGTLQELFFDDPNGLAQDVMRGIPGAFFALPPVKKGLMGDVLRSRFLGVMKTAVASGGKQDLLDMQRPLLPSRLAFRVGLAVVARARGRGPGRRPPFSFSRLLFAVARPRG